VIGMSGLLVKSTVIMKENLEELNALGLKTACLSNTNSNHWRLMEDRSGYQFVDLSKLTLKSQAALEGAREQAVARSHQTIDPEHVLFALRRATATA
jgi:cobalamin-dependent methionine synthase I